ncbi:MAG: phage tail tape measure protein [Acetobacter sp.]|uniref:phage tail tape measure protein n=1 Tax=Acetobacter sp. TaxID=440 RepID=UPI0039ED9062
MSGSQSLRAQFDLLFNVGPTEGLTQVNQVLDRIDQALERLRRAVDPFSEMTEPVARAMGATNRLNETLERTTAVSESVTQATAAVREELSGVGAAATEAGEGLTGMGRQAEEAAEQTVSAVGRMRGALTSLDGLSSGSADVRNPGSGLGGRLGSPVRAMNGLSESINNSVGAAFGAAATGFGLISPIHAAAEYDNDLTHIGIGLGLHGQANVDYGRAFGLRMDALARATGQRGSELVSAAGFLGREGYAGTRLDALLPTIAQIGTAYNANPAAIAKSTFALQESMHITDGNLGGALASLALAGKSADLPFEALAPLLPQVAAQAGALGVRGRSGVDDLAAALAVVRKSTGTEGEAVTDARRFLSDIISPHVNKRFQKFGVDLYSVEDKARKSGGDPMMAVMEQIDRLTNHGANRQVLGTLFGNQESQGFVQAILTHMDQYREIHARTSGANQSVINEDFDTGQQSTLIRLNAFMEALSQLQRRIGSSFVPTLNVLTGGLNRLIEAFDWANRVTHGWASTLTGGVGAFLAFATVLGVLKAVCGPLITGLRLLRVGTIAFEAAMLGLRGVIIVLAGLTGPFALAWIAAGVAIGAAAYLIITHWDKVKSWLSSFLGWAKSFGSTLAAIFTHPFDALGAAFSTIENRIANSSLGKMMGLHGAAPIPAGAGGGGQFSLHVTTDQGVHVRQTAGPRPITMGPDRGRMVNRP